MPGRCAGETGGQPAFPVRWRVFTVIALGSFVSYILRSNVSLAAPAMKADLGLSDGEWGLVLSAFIAGYALFQFPGGLAGDRFGPRKALTIIAILWALLTVVTAVVPGPAVAGTGLTLTLLILARFLVGAAHAPIFPVQNSAFCPLVPPRQPRAAPGPFQYRPDPGASGDRPPVELAGRRIRVADCLLPAFTDRITGRRPVVVVRPGPAR